jgi:hypothetical protein
VGEEWPPNMTNGHVLLRGPESSPWLQSTILYLNYNGRLHQGEGRVGRGDGGG